MTTKTDNAKEATMNANCTEWDGVECPADCTETFCQTCGGGCPLGVDEESTHDSCPNCGRDLQTTAKEATMGSEKFYYIAWGNGNVDGFLNRAIAKQLYADHPDEDVRLAIAEDGRWYTLQEAREQFGDGPHVSHAGEEDEEPPTPAVRVCTTCGDGFSYPEQDCPDCGGRGEIYES